MTSTGHDAHQLPSPPTISGKIAPVLIALGPTVALSIVYFILPVLAPSIMRAVDHPAEDYGWLAGAVGLGSVWFYTASHAVTPVLGPLGTLRLGLAISCAGIGLMLSGNWIAILIGGCLIGFGYATTTPASSQILADFTPKTSWGILFSVRQAGVPAGGMIAGVLSVATLVEFGWQFTLAICIGLIVILTALLILTPNRYNTSRPLQSFSLARFFSPLNFLRPLRDVRTVPGLPTLVAAGCGFAIVHGAVTSFYVIYLVRGLGLPQDTAAMLFVALQAAAIIGRIFFGALADRIGSPLPVLRFLAPFSGASAVMLSMVAPDWPPALHLASAVVIGFTVGTWNGLYLAEIARLAPPDAIASATASAAAFGFATYMITPPVVGVMAATYGWPPTFIAVATAAIFAGIVLAMRQWRTAGPS